MSSHISTMRIDRCVWFEADDTDYSEYILCVYRHVMIHDDTMSECSGRWVE